MRERVQEKGREGRWEGVQVRGRGSRRKGEVGGSMRVGGRGREGAQEGRREGE